MSRMPGTFQFRDARGEDEEGLFTRDADGQLVRLDAPTENDYGKRVTLQIDGKPVTVPMAEPLKDAQGNPIVDIDGGTSPRYTTIYDAALLQRNQSGSTGEFPIPILCHQAHMRPVAVCRMCVVQIYGQKRGKRSPERKLLPACQHQVKEGMEVFTRNDPGPDGERVRRTVGVLTELLAADHLKPSLPPGGPAEYDELRRFAERFAPDRGRRFQMKVTAAEQGDTVGPPRSRVVDDSSPVFIVDHSACILCDRCSRACDDVKENHIIGRVGKGSVSAIGFDLDDPMGKSGCVQCGECMVSCPTSAITFKPIAQLKLSTDRREVEVLSAAQLKEDPLFADVPGKFLLWQQGLVVRHQTKAGQVLARQGDPGNTAFLLKRGRVEVAGYPTKSGVTIRGRSASVSPAFRKEFGPADVMVGEMACLGGTPRTADIRAIEDGEIWEMRRNVLDRVLRSPSMRKRIEEVFRANALDSTLRASDMFRTLPPDEFARCIDSLRDKVRFVRVQPGQTLFRQGEWAANLYLLRLGHVRISVNRPEGDADIRLVGPGAVIGEIGLLAISPEDLIRSTDEVDALIAEAINSGVGPLSMALPAGKRSATCAALDHVELAVIQRADFLEMIRGYPRVRRALVDMSVSRLATNGDDQPDTRVFVEQGLFQAQSLLALDLNNCTRCDECTRACVQQHGVESHGAPITRLLRDGLRFGDYLVATSCRSCKDAYCMIGCPVDAIHRGRHQQIVIEDHCIGCGLCAQNCPYGNISMEPDLKKDAWAQGQPGAVARLKASVCDLCDTDGVLEVPVPKCVYACPHDAAHRMSGAELLGKVTGAT